LKFDSLPRDMESLIDSAGLLARLTQCYRGGLGHENLTFTGEDSPVLNLLLSVMGHLLSPRES
jgi:hypothetical protein